MTALQRLFSLVDGNNKTSIDYVIGESSLAYLYSQYRIIEEQCKKGSKKLDPYERTIEVDLPRTFPCSSFLEAHKDSFRQLLHAFVVYSPIAYVQGQNFLAAASLYYFSGKTPYLSFWLMVCLFDNLKHVFLLQIDESFFEENKMFHESTEEVVRIFVACYEKKHKGRVVSDLTLLTLKNLVQWKLIGTLLLSCCGSDLRNTRHIIRFFLPCLYDTKGFQRKAAAVALSFLFCCFMEKKLNEDLVLIVQDGNLSKMGLVEVLRASKNTEKLLS